MPVGDESHRHSPRRSAPHIKGTPTNPIHWECEELWHLTGPHSPSSNPHHLLRVRGTQSTEISELEISAELETKPTLMTKPEHSYRPAFCWLRFGSTQSNGPANHTALWLLLISVPRTPHDSNPEEEQGQ